MSNPRRTMADWRSLLNTLSPAQRTSVFSSNPRVKRELSQYYTQDSNQPRLSEPEAAPAFIGPMPRRDLRWYSRASETRAMSPGFSIACKFAASVALKVAPGIRRRTNEEMQNAIPRQKHSVSALLENAYDYSDAINNGHNPYAEVIDDEIIWAELPEVAAESDWSEGHAEDCDTFMVGEAAYRMTTGRAIEIARKRPANVRIVRL